MRKRALGTLAHAGRVIALTGVFAGALVVGVSLHANLVAVRRAAQTIGNDVMASLFEGKVVITDVQSLSIGRSSSLRARHVEVTDPEGKRVVSADGLEATIDLEKLLQSLARGRGPVVELSNVHIANADVVLDTDANGLKIARTFRPRPKAPSAITTTPAAASGPPREPTLHIAKTTIDHAHVHGNLVPPSLDGEADDLRATVNVDPVVLTNGATSLTARIELIDGKVALVSPRAPNQKCTITGRAKGFLEVPLSTKELHGRAELQDGKCGDIPVVSSARIDGEEVEANVDIARTEPAAIEGAFSGLPFKQALEVHAHAKGKLQAIAIDGRVNLGDQSKLVLTGEIDMRAGHAFKLDADATKIDAAALGAPIRSDITAKVHAEGTLGGGEGGGPPVGTFRVTTEEGTIHTEKAPPATIEGRFEEKQITATFKATEPGVDANGKVIFDVPSKMLTFDLQARSSSLRALSRAPNKVGGAATARAQGKIDLEAKTIQATTAASGDGITVDGFTAKHVNANGKLAGPLAAPMLDVTFNGDDLKLQANGKTPLVYPHATGTARIALAPSPEVLAAEINVTGTGEHEVTASSKGVSFANGVVEARGLRITGLGDPLEVDASFGKGAWSVRAKSANIDLHRAAAVTGIKELKILPEGTHAAVDVDVRQLPSGADGHLDVVVTSEKGFGMGALTAEAHAKIDRGRLTGNAKVAAEGFGVVEVRDAELDLPAGKIDARSLQRTTGSFEVRGTVDLSQGAALFAGENVERVAGIASFEARVERGDPNALPAVRGTVRTDRLEVVLSSGEPGPDGPPKSITIHGVDVLVHAAWDGRTEDGEIAVTSWDSHGLLGSASAKSRVPLWEWATGAEKLDSRAIGRLEVDATADVPARDLAELPDFLDLPDLRGLVDARVHVAGSIAHPRVLVSAHANGLSELKPQARGARGAGGRAATFEPLDGTLEGRWDGERAAITFALDERPPKQKDKDDEKKKAALRAANVALPGRGGAATKKEPGHLRGLILLSDVRATDLLRERSLARLPWRASTEVEVQNLALAALPIRPYQLTGSLTGRARITDLNRDPSFEAKAHIDGFGTGGAKVQSADITLGGRNKSLFAFAELLDTKKGQQDSKATIQIASQSPRINALDFTWDDTSPTQVNYAVQNGRLGLLAPIVRRSISEIDGRVDGAGSITIEGANQVFDGGLAVHEARLYVNSFGEEITGLAATARFDKTGTFRIDDASGRIGQGEFRASANGRMSGFRFVGVDATVIASKEGVPLSSESVTFAVATGEVKISAKMTDDRSSLVAVVEVPRANVTLPDRGAQKLEGLDPDPTIAVGIRRKADLDTKAVRRARGGTGGRAGTTTTTTTNPNGTTTQTTSASLITKITVTLGDSVHLEGRGLDVSLGGKTIVELAEELRVTGRIDLRGGTIEVHGRRFTVDRGVVTFPEGGDAANPTVVAAAYWDAPDRTRVWVEFTGPLKSGKLTLRSEPAYSKNEILSVLLFGRPDPNMGTGGGTADQGGDASGATAVGSGFVASDLNRMLSELDENLDVETDTLSGNRTRTKLGRSFFDRRLKVQIGYAPGHTYREPDTTFLFLNWQFIPKWSLVATRGDKGTSILDVLFQHRY